MEVKIGLTEESITAGSHLLEKVLSDEFVLYTKTRKAHWCVVGPDFYNKHKYFEELYLQLEEIIDEVAERIRILGHFPVATLHAFINLTSLTENSRHGNTSEDFINELLNDHETIIFHLRGNIDNFNDKLHDAGTADYLTGLMGSHEKIAWMLRSHLG